MFVGTLADVLHTQTDSLFLIGMPKIGAERWGLHTAFTTRWTAEKIRRSLRCLLYK